MSTLRSIEIDLDVHKCLEAERQGFDEAPNDVLRRLLKLKPSAKRPNGGGESVAVAGGRSWSGKRSHAAARHAAPYGIQWQKPRGSN